MIETPVNAKVMANDILKALQEQYIGKTNFSGEQFVFFPHLRTGTGFSKDCEQELDAWAMQLWGEKHRITFEVKISRSDFQVEIKKPIKRRIGLMVSNEFYFVTPKGMLKPTEIPIECGLKELWEDGRIHTIVAAPYRDTPPPTWRFLGAVCRRIAREERTATE